jgi:hypothetical protein
LTASSKAACTCSGGCAFCIVTLDQDAALVAVENVLHQLGGLGRDLLAPFVEHEVHLALADDFAHRSSAAPSRNRPDDGC